MRLLWLFLCIILNTCIGTILLSFLRFLWFYSYCTITINCYIVWNWWQLII
uniref:Uncharacterized protein n=1 Tax=virus sp. ctBM815 TaxID=2825806 RepID=A0A8S5RKB8_9VIRU|nr:MAG TPA: hypothetical protein [virus sp. ctBM815]